MLPAKELLASIESVTFAPLADIPEYSPLDDDEDYDKVSEVPAEAWDLAKRVRAAIPGAETSIRLNGNERYSVYASVQVGPHKVYRDFAV